jgi:hypothetical protein
MIRSTVARANYFVLQKNNLAVQQASDVADMINRLVGIPAVPITTPAFAARARVVKFSPKDLADPALVVSPLMRSVPYFVPVHRLITWYAATARQRKQAINADLRLWGIETNDAIEKLAGEVLGVLDDRPATETEVTARLSKNVIQPLSRTSRGGKVTHTTNVALALRWLVAHGQLIAENVADDWREEQLVYERLTDRIPNFNLAGLPSEADAQKVLVQAYLSAFGPATEADISAWTGLGKSETARATGALAGETVLTMVEGIPGMLLLLKTQADALQNVTPPTQPVVSVLPADDPYTTAYRASRARYVTKQKLLRQVFSSSGASRASILVNGQIVGIWDWSRVEAGYHRVQWQPFTKTDPAVEPLVSAEISRAAAFLDPQAEVVRVENK